MGSAIARRLAGFGVELVLWNRTRGRAAQLHLGDVAHTPANAVARADVVLSSLTGTEAVRDVYLGSNGALEGASQQLFLEMSTAGLGIIRELDAATRERKLHLLDAPIFGSPPAVETGDAFLFVGGRNQDVDRARSVLEMLGTMRHAGRLGAGARLKLLANSMLAGSHALAAELIGAGLALGLDRETVFWALSLQAPYLMSRRAGYAEGRFPEPLFSLWDLLKDVNLAVEHFSQVRASTPVLAKVREVIDESVPTIGTMDLSALVSRYVSVDAGEGVNS
jgi:3-hydroxyisobutyrate dehydrogenase-like beta-hydroxyacid dehydrogenase